MMIFIMSVYSFFNAVVIACVDIEEDDDGDVELFFFD
jgi:hypothetical protein